MLRTKEQIQQDFEKATKRMRPFYKQCLLSIEILDEDSIKRNYDGVRANIAILKDRKKDFPQGYQYKDELKDLRKQLKWLKYLIIKPLKGRSKRQPRSSSKSRQ